MKRFPVFILLLALLSAGASAWNLKEKYRGPKTPTTDTSWHPDILPGYEARYVNQGEAYDGPCRSTIIRKLCPGKSTRAYLYIHGYNDYFFQQDMGERVVDSGYNFYAVDLRRYGRSREPWQWPFDVRNVNEYFCDIDSAINQIRRDGNTDITLAGHSTGGLTVTLYGEEKGARCQVNRIVTDSPFYEWNFSSFMRNVAFPTVGFLGKIFKNAKVNEKGCDGYGYSLLKEYYGEWTYNTEWKMIYSPPKTMAWINAINSAQSRLIKYKENITVPLLVMHSSRKISGCNYTPEFQTGDCVLDPEMIQRIGSTIGHRTETCTIDSGLHDLILSRKEVRDAAYDSIFSFIRKN